MLTAPEFQQIVMIDVHCSPDGQLGGTLHQSLPVLGGDSTGNLGAEGLVGHHQDFQLLDVVDEDLLEARGQHVPRVGGATVTNVGHLVHSLELPPHSVVNTLRIIGQYQNTQTQR